MPKNSSPKKKVAKNLKSPSASLFMRNYIKHTIAIVGSAQTGHKGKESIELAQELGELVAAHNAVLMTPVMTGISYWAAKGAKQAGGFVIGVSPAQSLKEHTHVYNLPTEYHDIIIYTGQGHAGADAFLGRGADALIAIGSKIGTLNQITTAAVEGKPVGILDMGTDTSTLTKSILKETRKGHARVLFEKKPQDLVAKLLKEAKEATSKEESGKLY